MRQFTRVDTVRNILDGMILENQDLEERRCAYVHLYGVGLMASMLALKRGMGVETAELGQIAGMLHDYTKYLDRAHPKRNTGDGHAQESAAMAGEILRKTGAFTPEEIARIGSAIEKHSDKDRLDTPFDELIKAADRLQHWLRNPREEFWYQEENCAPLAKELGMGTVEF